MSVSTTAISISSLHHHFRIHRPSTFSRATLPQISSPQSLRLATTASISGRNSGESEDSRWLREEQRWLREEQRWLREESRWISERESLLREISILKLRIQRLESESEHRNLLSDSVSQIDSVSQTTISLPSPRSVPLAISSSSSSSSSPSPPPTDEHQNPPAKATKVHRKTLKNGSEGDEVRDLQEALLKLGFYSGEEDMEYSAFSSGTERAVKTWQASIEIPEDGIMTDELLTRLYSSKETDEPDPLGNANGTVLASVTESVETRKTIVKKEEKTDMGVSHQRVFLLGENRWEEPSRLIGNDKQGGAKKVHGAPITCIACRGEGHIMCTECDGTGEPNIEPQFLEWMDEGTKCAYCEGLGHTVCDVCEGKTAV